MEQDHNIQIDFMGDHRFRDSPVCQNLGFLTAILLNRVKQGDELTPAKEDTGNMGKTHKTSAKHLIRSEYHKNHQGYK